MGLPQMTYVPGLLSNGGFTQTGWQDTPPYFEPSNEPQQSWLPQSAESSQVTSTGLAPHDFHHFWQNDAWRLP